VDAIKLPDTEIPQTSLIKGDRRSLSIAAASILAKMTRDQIMDELANQYPDYGFEQNKGYGTAAHRQAIHDIRPCEIHRFSFAPIRQDEEEETA
jgi:ribonuclease HII